jgi:isopentenyl phosphate kinase
MKHGIPAAVIKLGGSVITLKSAGRPAVRRKVVERLGGEIASAGLERVVIVHGAGSFGHTIVRRTGIDRGIRGRRGLRDWSEAQLGQNVLNVEVTRLLIAAGIPAFACQPTGMVVLRAGRLARLETEALRGLVSMGLVPVLFGVPAYDQRRGCTILSGDLLAPAVAHLLGMNLVIHATDVDGVYDSDPRSDRKARRIDVIDRHNWSAARKMLGASRSIDVTGGMKGKVNELIAWARRGVRARIIDAAVPGRLADALAGKEIGTFVTW